MKKPYSTPTLLVHGTVEKLTARVGAPVEEDTLFTSTGTIPGVGSRDTCEAYIPDGPCLPGVVGE